MFKQVGLAGIRECEDFFGLVMRAHIYGRGMAF